MFFNPHMKSEQQTKIHTKIMKKIKQQQQN